MKGAVVVLTLLLVLAAGEGLNKVIMKSCSGCRLNRLPLVKQFINEEAAKYNMEVLYVGGDPRLVFLDELGTEVETIDISNFDVGGIKSILEKRGFTQKST